MNPEESLNGAVPETTPSQTSVPAEPTTPVELAAPEAPAAQASVADTNETPSAPATEAPSAQPTIQSTPKPTVPEGKAGKSGLVILLIVIIILLLLGGAGYGIYRLFSSKAGDWFSGPSSNSSSQQNGGNGASNTTTPINNEITAANKKMREELPNFNYDATITMETDYMDLDTTMNCTYDGVNKLEYCHTEALVVEQEQYWDWANGVMYSKAGSFISIGDETGSGWTKTSTATSACASTWTEAADHITIDSSTVKDGGTLYKGKINSKNLGGTGSDTSAVVSEDIAIDVFVNTDGYIETMDLKTELAGTKTTIHVDYYDYGTAGSLSIPAEALE